MRWLSIPVVVGLLSSPVLAAPHNPIEPVAAKADKKAEVIRKCTKVKDGLKCTFDRKVTA